MFMLRLNCRSLTIYGRTGSPSTGSLTFKHQPPLHRLAFEGSGVPARYPHNPALYRAFLSKEWSAMLCAAPGNPYRIPATTRVSVGAIASDAPRAASVSLRALRDIEAASGYSVAAGKPKPVRP